MDEAGDQRDSADNPASWRKSWLALLLIVLFIGAVFGLIVFLGVKFFSNPEIITRDYNQYTFTKSEGLWWTQVQKGSQPYTLPFYYAPWEVEDIPVQRSSLEPIWVKQLDRSIKVYISVDPEGIGTSVVSAANIGRVVGNRYRLYNMNVSSAFVSDPGYPYAIADCSNSSENIFVIVVDTGDANKVETSGNAGTCFTVTGKNDTEILRAGDAYTYRLLGIIKTPA